METKTRGRRTGIQQQMCLEIMMITSPDQDYPVKFYYSKGSLVKEQLIIFAQRFGTVLSVDIDPYAVVIHFDDKDAAEASKIGLHNTVMPNGSTIFSLDFPQQNENQSKRVGLADRPKTTSATPHRSSAANKPSSSALSTFPDNTASKLAERLDFILVKLSSLESKVDTIQNQIGKVLLQAQPASSGNHVTASPTLSATHRQLSRNSSSRYSSATPRRELLPLDNDQNDDPNWYMAKLPSAPAAFAPGQIVKASITQYSTRGFDSVIYAAEGCLRLITPEDAANKVSTSLINDILSSCSAQLDCRVSIEDVINKINRYAQAFQVLSLRRPGQADMFGKMSSPRQLLIGTLAAGYHKQYNAPIGVLVARQLDAIAISIQPNETYTVFDPKGVPCMQCESNIEAVLAKLDQIGSTDNEAPDDWDDDDKQEVEFAVVKRYFPVSTLPQLDTSRLFLDSSIKKLLLKFDNLENRTIALEDDISAVLKVEDIDEEGSQVLRKYGRQNSGDVQKAEMEIRQQTVRQMLDSQAGFTCAICSERIDTSNMFVVSSCGHFACRNCIHHHMAVKITEGDYPVSCPLCLENRNVFTEQETSSILDLNELQTLEKNMLNRMFDANCFHCLTPDCSYFAEVVPPRTFFECEICGAEVCIVCKNQWHEGPCDSKRNNESNVDVKFVRKCPRCSNGIEKTQGCNSIRCRCGAHFCYLCGLIFESNDWEDHACGQFEGTAGRLNSFDDEQDDIEGGLYFGDEQDNHSGSGSEN